MSDTGSWILVSIFLQERRHGIRGLNLFHQMDDCISPHQRRFGGLSLSTTAINAPMEMIWAPALEISQTPAYYLIKVKMPRRSKEEVRVMADSGIVTFSGERKPDTAPAKERLPPSFTRSFSLRSTSTTGALRLSTRTAC